MQKPPNEDEVIAHLTRWANDRDSVRAVILTSSRAIPDASMDILSDYDPILVVRDVDPFYQDRAWLGDFGPVLVVYRDPLTPYYGFPKTCFVTQYEHGLKIDFSVWPVEILRAIASAPQLPDEFDAGYRVLLDKDGLTRGLNAPTYGGYIPRRPTESEYRTMVELLFHEATYVAKHLWRGDLMTAKINMDYNMKAKDLRLMLEWLIEIDHGWTVKPGPYGRKLKKWLRPDLWAELECTYTGADLEENWEALFRTIVLCRKVAIEVGDCLGFRYPQDLHDRSMAYLQWVKALPHLQADNQ